VCAAGVDVAVVFSRLGAYCAGMTPVADSDIPALCAAAQVILEQLDGGTVRISLSPPFEWFDVASASLLDEAGPFVLIGRERRATLGNARGRKRMQAKRKFPVLASHRVALIEEAKELSKAVETLARVGVCVENDAYVFPTDGRWIVYVGHDDGIVQYVPRSQRPVA
jgi:hypothetical protein